MCRYYSNPHGEAAGLSSSIELGAYKRAWSGRPGDGVSLIQPVSLARLLPRSSFKGTKGQYMSVVLGTSGGDCAGDDSGSYVIGVVSLVGVDNMVTAAVGLALLAATVTISLTVLALCYISGSGLTCDSIHVIVSSPARDAADLAAKTFFWPESCR